VLPRVLPHSPATKMQTLRIIPLGSQDGRSICGLPPRQCGTSPIPVSATVAIPSISQLNLPSEPLVPPSSARDSSSIMHQPRDFSAAVGRNSRLASCGPLPAPRMGFEHPRPQTQGWEGVKEWIISRRDAEAQRFKRNNGLVFLSACAPLRLGAR
jgi:hypothetical protein